MSKTEKLVKDRTEDFASSTLGSVSVRSGFDGRIFGAKIVQAAMGNCLNICIVQKRNGRVPFHTNSTSLYIYQSKFLSNIKTELNIDD